MTTTSVAGRPDAISTITSSVAVQRNPARRGPVLLAVDPTSPRDSVTPAARAARMLSQRLNVPLRVITVVEPWPYYAAAAGLGPIVLPADQELRKASEQGVRAMLTEVLADAAWSLAVRTGRQANEVRAFALEIDATIIVTPAAPHMLFGRAVVGARAVQVLRGAPCPVLSVEPTFSGLPRKLLAAVDFSPASIRAAQAALLLAADDAQLTLVHVLPEGIPGRVVADVPVRKETQILFDRLREQLAPFTPAGTVLETRELRGEVVQQLLECAESLGADLLATGTEGPGLVERMFLGSTAASVVHLARSSVLASPAPRSSEAIDMQLHLQGTATVTRSEEWPDLLDAVSRRDIGRRVTMEVDDRDIGAQIEASGYSLRGITFDPHDRQVAIMVEAPQGTNAHLTRSISNVDSIGITTNPDGSDRALVIKHGRGQTLLYLTN